MSSLSQILASLTLKSAVYTAIAGDEWSQGRTVFGGLIAALANAAIRNIIGADRPLRALQIVYIGPNSPGGIDFEPQILRAGKAVTLAMCTVRSAGEVSATVTAMYGAPRQSMLSIHPQPIGVSIPPEQLTDVPERSGLPSFTRQYHQRWARGGFPYSKSTNSPMSVYLRYRGEQVSRLTETHAVAMMDAIPSPALALLETPSPASTLSWTLEVLDHRFDFGVDEWWRLDADVDAAADGYVAHTSYVINPAGRVAAISRQVVVVYG
jgi:acyl-CoA thioesterase